MNGSTPGVAITIAAALLDEGVANYILFVNGDARDPENPELDHEPPGEAREVNRPDFHDRVHQPLRSGRREYTYGLLYTRHMYEFGTKPEQLARIA